MSAIHVRDDYPFPIAPWLIGRRWRTIFSWLNEASILHVRLTRQSSAAASGGAHGCGTRGFNHKKNWIVCRLAVGCSVWLGLLGISEAFQHPADRARQKKKEQPDEKQWYCYEK